MPFCLVKILLLQYVWGILEVNLEYFYTRGENIEEIFIFLARLSLYLQTLYNKLYIDMENKSDKQDVRQPDVQPSQRKQFHGFSMGFLLILLAVVVGVYIVCTIIAGGN